MPASRSRSPDSALFVEHVAQAQLEAHASCTGTSPARASTSERGMIAGMRVTCFAARSASASRGSPGWPAVRFACKVCSASLAACSASSA
jgi:hypothetical protein